MKNLTDQWDWVWFLFIPFVALTLFYFITSCTEVGASTRIVQCETVKGPPVIQGDGMCPLDKNGTQMVMAGQFSAYETNDEGQVVRSERTACVSIEKHCTVKE